jgi:hypothetical protein
MQCRDRFVIVAWVAGSLVLLALGARTSGGSGTRYDVVQVMTGTAATESAGSLGDRQIAQHPLQPAISFARKRYDFVRSQVRDFVCVLVRRERIGEQLRSHEFISTKVRLEQSRDGQIQTPLSVFMHYLGPEEYRGRKVLYVAGRNDGKLVVRNGGRRFNYITVRITPDSSTVRRESRYPVTELSLEKVAGRLIEKAEDDVRFDPEGRNTVVTFFRDAKVDGRVCTRIRVVHPVQDDNLSFHTANVFVDDELNVPIRVEGYGWPKKKDEAPPLLEEYTFTKLSLNVGLTDADFDVSQLQK